MNEAPHRPQDGLSRIDRLSEAIGHAVSWITLAMVAVTFAVVVLRYVLATGWVWLQESVTWMHAVVFILGAAYALKTGDHVRVDVFYRRFAPRTQAWVDLLGTLLLLLPTCVFLVYASYDYVASSWAIRESSREAGGMPGLFLLKTVIPVTAGLLALQGVSEVVRAIRRLQGRGGSERGQTGAAPAG